MNLSPLDYDTMSFKDLDIKYEGWRELRKATLYDSWEQIRTTAFYSLHQPSFMIPKGRGFKFTNPYGEKEKKVKGKNFSKKELDDFFYDCPQTG